MTTYYCRDYGDEQPDTPFEVLYDFDYNLRTWAANFNKAWLDAIYKMQSHENEQLEFHFV